MTPRVKVCGITRLEDAEAAVALGAAAVGFIFWPQSPRYIEPARARDIVRQLHDTHDKVEVVGVFVDQPPGEVDEVLHQVGCSTLQLHGDEQVADYETIPLELVKAVAVDAGVIPEAARRLPPRVLVLLDAHDPIRRGGTGRTIDWTAAATLAGERRVLLSGGLTSDNVGEAIAAVRPYGLDVSSGVERSPGVKDPVRLRAFFDAVRAADAPGARTSRTSALR